MQSVRDGVTILWLLLSACGRTAREEPAAPQAESSSRTVQPPAIAEVTPLSSKLARTAPPRLVGIGDLHGDLDHARRALRLAGAIDEHDAWIGGPLVVVQTGDEIDRGDDDRAILDLFEALVPQAAAAGGAVVPLLGNHELMNAALDFRYVTPAGFTAFAPFASAAAPAPSFAVAALPVLARGRGAAFAPGGPYAQKLAHRALIAKVGDTLFVHGGILPKHVTYGLDRMNDEVSGWLAGSRDAAPSIVTAEDGPVWTRAYSSEEGPPDCADLERVLRELGAARMVVAHTVQPGGITSACAGKVWKIDVGLSRFYGGRVAALEIKGDDVHLLQAAAP